MKSFRSFGLIFATTVLLALAGCGITVVPTGHVGVQTHFGKPTGELLENGIHGYNPFTDTVHKLSTQVQLWDGTTEAYTHDVQEATVKFTINYQLEAPAAIQVYQNVGEEWANALMPQVIFKELKDTVGQWDAVDLISNRAKVNATVAENITKALAQRHIICTSFSLTDFEFSRAFNTAVEAKVIAQQRAQEALNKTEQVKQEANQTVLTAEAQAQSMKIRADALERNPKLVEWEAVQHWDGHLPQQMFGNAVPFIQVNSKQ